MDSLEHEQIDRKTKEKLLAIVSRDVFLRVSQSLFLHESHLRLTDCMTILLYDSDAVFAMSDH